MNTIFGDNYILEKANDIDICKRNIVLCFSHMLKFQYQKQRQGVSWIRTIIENRNKANAYLKNTNTYNEINTCIDDLYNKAVKDANNEIGNNVHDNIPIYKPSEYNISIFIEKESISKFLRNNARDKDILEKVEIGLQKLR